MPIVLRVQMSRRKGLRSDFHFCKPLVQFCCSFFFFFLLPGDRTRLSVRRNLNLKMRDKFDAYQVAIKYSAIEYTSVNKNARFVGREIKDVDTLRRTINWSFSLRKRDAVEK